MSPHRLKIIRHGIKDPSRTYLSITLPKLLSHAKKDFTAQGHNDG